MKQITFHFQVTPEIKEKVQELAANKHLKMSDVLRLALYDYLEKEGM